MSIERAIERRGTGKRSVTMPGKSAVQTDKKPEQIALEIRSVRLSKRIEAIRK
jgi:hypothetical protein